MSQLFAPKLPFWLWGRYACFTKFLDFASLVEMFEATTFDGFKWD